MPGCGPTRIPESGLSSAGVGSDASRQLWRLSRPNVEHQHARLREKRLCNAVTAEFEREACPAWKRVKAREPLGVDAREDIAAVKPVTPAIEAQLDPPGRDILRLPPQTVGNIEREPRERAMLSGADTDLLRRSCTGTEPERRAKQRDTDHAAACLTFFNASSRSVKLGRKCAGVFWRPTSMQMLVA